MHKSYCDKKLSRREQLYADARIKALEEGEKKLSTVFEKFELCPEKFTESSVRMVVIYYAKQWLMFHDLPDNIVRYDDPYRYKGGNGQ
jgi:hypothetical protein